MSRRRERYSDDDLRAALREAAQELAAPLRYHAYRVWARDRQEHGLAGPSAQTVVLRLQTWRQALAAAGLPVSTGSGRSRTYDREDGVRALAQAWRELGRVPSVKAYEAWRAGRRDLPSPVTVRRLADNWDDLLREASVRVFPPPGALRPGADSSTPGPVSPAGAP